MKIADMRELKIDELHIELDKLRRHLFDLRSQATTEKLEDSSQLGKTKRDIARVLTVLNERGEENIEQKQYHMESVGHL
ncbi:MAG: 50S ribosomal protein L29 [Planctomycetes bacterium]|nr:50S ribosomal protein L29 [Planctomycetota bacterium]